MKFIKTKLSGLMVLEPDVYEDGRGFFLESYNREKFVQHGIEDFFLQDNHSCSSKGVLRGLHYQLKPYGQAKLIRVTRGSVFDVVVDIRKQSRTFGCYHSDILTETNKKMIYIPEGFAHGFLVLEDQTDFLYKVSNIYSREHERGILWNDPRLAIPWPVIEGGYLLSEKDQKYPCLENAES